MGTTSRFQFNAIVGALLTLAANTVAALGYLGVGVAPATDYTFGYLHNNALLDTRGFTSLNSGGPSVPTLDTNGLPTGAATLCFDTAASSVQPGPLPAGSYYLNVKSVGQTVTASDTGFAAGAMTLGTGIPQGDGVTIRYPLTINSGYTGTAALNFSGAMSAFPDIARNGATSSTGQPLFCTDALSYYSRFSTLRLMDFLFTNTRTDVAWSDRPADWALHAYNQPYSWEKMVAFVNAVATYPGSALKSVFINIPGYADTNYRTSLATALTSLGLTSAVQVYVQRANEHWNPAFTFFGAYQTSAMAELNYLANYPATVPAISTVTSDGTTLTFTTTSPISSAYLTTTASCVVTDVAGNIVVGSYASPVTATKTGTSTFTIPSAFTAVGTERVIFGGQPVITKVVSDGTKLTFTTAAPIGSYLTTTANCVVVGGAGGFSVGTQASPVVATKTGANTFTVPTASTYNGTGFMGVIFNLASSLVTDGVLPDVFHVSNKWFVRLMYQDQQAWSAIRPQDRFFMDTALYGSQGPGGSASTLIEYAYAAYVGGGSATWLYGAAVGLYITATVASTTLNLLFAELNTLLSTVTDGEIRAHVYQCKLLGIHPMAYEAAPDLQKTPTLMVSAMTDARMSTVVVAMLARWYANGGEILNFYNGTPAVFSNVAQGGWSALQAYTDLASPKIAAVLAYPPTPVAYANIYGAPGSIALTSYYQKMAPNGNVINGLWGWFSGAGYYIDNVVAVPVTGSYMLTVVGLSKLANVVTLYVDPTNNGASNGTFIGTSTLPATGGGWNTTDTSANASAVVDPVTVTLSAGIHVLRIVPTTGGNTGAALLRVDTQLN